MEETQSIEVQQDSGTQVFISYSHADEEIARKITERLREAKIGVWFDQDSLFPGQDWGAEISKALSRCNAMLAVVTSSYLASSNSNVELGYALGNSRFKGKLIPIYIRDKLLASKHEIPWILLSINGVDLNSGSTNLDADLDRVIRSLLSTPHFPELSNGRFG